MSGEVSCAFSLSSLHDHVNSKIARFRAEAVAEHREWMSIFMAEARSTILRSSHQDEPVNILPPRTPRAPRRRRGAAKQIADASPVVEEDMPLEGGAGSSPRARSTSAAVTFAASTLTASTAHAGQERQQQRATRSTRAARTAASDVAAPPQPAEEPMEAMPVGKAPIVVDLTSPLAKRSASTSSRKVAAAAEPYSSVAATTPVERRRLHSPVSDTTTTTPTPGVLTPPVKSSPEHVEIEPVPAEECRSPGSSPSNADSEEKELRPDRDVLSLPELSRLSSTPADAAKSPLPTTPSPAQEPSDELVCATPVSAPAGVSPSPTSAPASDATDAPLAQVPSPLLEDDEEEEEEEDAEPAAMDLDIVERAVAKPPLVGQASTPTAGLRRTPGEKRALRSAHSAGGGRAAAATLSKKNSSVRRPARVGGQFVPAEFASPMPHCYGLGTDFKVTPNSPKQSSAIPPSASRILRSALRKHGAEADVDLLKFKASTATTASLLRLGAPQRAFHHHAPASPTVSGNGAEADDGQPKVLKRLNNLVSSVASFIPHAKTPKKLDGKAKQEKLKAELDAKQKQTDDRKRKKEEARLQDLEEKRLKRVERERQTRKRKAELEEERNAKLLKKPAAPTTSAPSSAPASAAMAAQKKKEQEEVRRKEQRKLEADAKRKLEESQQQKRRFDAARKVAASNAAAAPSSGIGARTTSLLSPPLTSASARTKSGFASPRPVKSNSTLASSQLSRVFGDTALGRSTLTGSAQVNYSGFYSGSSSGNTSAGSGAALASKTLPKTIAHTLSSVLSSSATPIDPVVTAPAPTAHSMASAPPAKKPLTPSCSNIVRAFPSSTGGKTAMAKASSTPHPAVSSASAASAAVPKAGATIGSNLPSSLRPIPESSGDSRPPLPVATTTSQTSVSSLVGSSATLPTSSSNGQLARSPLKALNRTYTMPGSANKKASPLPKSRTASQLELSYSHQNMVPSTPPPPAYSNYSIDDIESDDPTDDEDSPVRKIPKWAQQGPLKRALIDQELSGNVADNLFPIADLETPNLTRIFQRERQRYLKRTSSAVWNSPLVKQSRT